MAKTNHLFIHLHVSIGYMDLKQFEKISKALGDINRLKILEDMSRRGGTVQCSDIIKVIDLAQPSVSHHIKALLESGLIIAEKSGRNYTYLLNKTLLAEFLTKLASFTDDCPMKDGN